MSATVLGNLKLAYELVWDRQRRPRGIHLTLDAADDSSAIDGAHLLNLLMETLSEQSPQPLLSATSPGLLQSFLQHARATDPWIVVSHHQLQDAATRALVQAAAACGAQLVWRAPPTEEAPPPELANCFARGLFNWGATNPSQPAHAQQICEGITSLALATRHLDTADAWGVLGWPADDALRAIAQQAQPDREAVQALIDAVDKDASTERIEDAIEEQPALAWRFLAHLNSAALGLRHPAESLRHGLMMLGMKAFRQWLEGQLARAEENRELQPVRIAMVLHARLAEALLDAGQEHQLHREVYLCALLSRIAPLLREPLPQLLRQITVAERTRDALLARKGPYAPYLALAEALANPADLAHIPALCEEQELDIADVNRSTLRVLAQVQARSGKIWPRGI